MDTKVVTIMAKFYSSSKTSAFLTEFYLALFPRRGDYKCICNSNLLCQCFHTETACSFYNKNKLKESTLVRLIGFAIIVTINTTPVLFAYKNSTIGIGSLIFLMLVNLISSYSIQTKLYEWKIIPSLLDREIKKLGLAYQAELIKSQQRIFELESEQLATNELEYYKLFLTEYQNALFEYELHSSKQNKEALWRISSQYPRTYDMFLERQRDYCKNNNNDRYMGFNVSFTNPYDLDKLFIAYEFNNELKND